MSMRREQLDAWTRPGNHLSRHLAHLRDAAWPATREELIDFVARTSGPLQLLDDLYALPEDGTRYATPEIVLAPAQSLHFHWPPWHPQQDHGAA
ncbi:MAG TPA: DUF2795 domain-containing protein [Nannocystis sp.]